MNEGHEMNQQANGAASSADGYLIFVTSQADLQALNMKLCRVVRELIVGKEVDEDCAPMYRVRFAHGREISVFADELIDPNWEQSSSGGLPNGGSSHRE